MPEIPSKLHAIWLGKLPPEDAKQNILNWKLKNPNHESNLWIDSKTYPPEKKSELDNLKQWAEKNGVRLRDLSGSDKAFREKMLSRQFYEAELQEPDANYAAAADILRAEILFHEGGIYHDIRDIFPGNPVKTFNPEFGFCCRRTVDTFCNDILASVPNGEMISLFRNVIHQNYIQLYKNPWAVKAHRNFLFNLPGMLDRRDSTIDVSGPGALVKALELFARVKKYDHKDFEPFTGNIDHSSQQVRSNKRVEVSPPLIEVAPNEIGFSHSISTEFTRRLNASTKFPRNFYKMPREQRHDWYSRISEEKYFKEIIRNYTYFYLSTEIAKQVAVTNDRMTRDLLHQWDKIISTASLDKSALEVLEECQKAMMEVKHYSSLHQTAKNFLEKFQMVADALENQFLIRSEGNKAGVLTLLKKLSMEKDKEDQLIKKNFHDFFEEVLYKNGGNAPLAVMQQFVDYRLVTKGTEIGFFRSNEVKGEVKENKKLVSWFDKHATFFMGERMVAVIDGDFEHPVIRLIDIVLGKEIQFQEKGKPIFPCNLPLPFYPDSLIATPGGERLYLKSFLTDETYVYSNTEKLEQLKVPCTMVLPLDAERVACLDRETYGGEIVNLSSQEVTHFGGDKMIRKLVLADHGNMIAGLSGQMIAVFNKKGVLKAEFKTNCMPNFIASIECDRMAVADRNANFISIYTTSGRLVHQFPTSIKEDYELRQMATLKEGHLALMYRGEGITKLLIYNPKDGRLLQEGVVDFSIESAAALKCYCEDRLDFVKEVSSYRLLHR